MYECVYIHLLVRFTGLLTDSFCDAIVTISQRFFLIIKSSRITCHDSSADGDDFEPFYTGHLCLWSSLVYCSGERPVILNSLYVAALDVHWCMMGEFPAEINHVLSFGGVDMKAAH